MADAANFTSLLFQNGINRNGNYYHAIDYIVDDTVWERFISRIEMSSIQHHDPRIRFVILDSIQIDSQPKPERVNWKEDGF